MSTQDEIDATLKRFREVEKSKPKRGMTDGQITVFNIKRQSDLIRLNRELAQLQTLKTIEEYKKRGNNGE